MEYASPRTRKLLQDYAAQHTQVNVEKVKVSFFIAHEDSRASNVQLAVKLPSCSALAIARQDCSRPSCVPPAYLQAASGPYGLQQVSQARQVATHELHVNLGPLTARAAFSHVPFWQSAAAMVSRIVQRPTPGNPVAAPGSKAAGYEVLLLSCSQSACDSFPGAQLGSASAQGGEGSARGREACMRLRETYLLRAVPPTSASAIVSLVEALQPALAAREWLPDLQKWWCLWYSCPHAAKADRYTETAGE